MKIEIMNHSINIAGILTVLCLLFALAACHNHEHDHLHDHGDHSGHGSHDDHKSHNDDHGGNKMVELNLAQFKNAEIDTGWFSLKNLSAVVHANGHTKLDPQDQADVSLPFPSSIKSIKVIEGSFVKKGEVLATVASFDIHDKLLELAKLEEQLALSESRKVYLSKEFQRQKKLAEDNINARKKLEKVSADLQMEQDMIASAQKQIRIMTQSLNSYGADANGLIPIKAPISGHITHVDLKIGSTVPAGSNMFSIIDNSKMHADLLVYEKDLSQIKVGQKVRFILTNQSNQEIKGEIYNIGKSFENETKSVAVHADIEANDANLIPGMYLSALIDIGQSQEQAVPESALVHAEGRDFVFVWEGENADREEGDLIHFMRVEVKTGARQLGWVAATILEEIHEGDRLVLDGAYYLQSHLQKSEGGGGHHH